VTAGLWRGLPVVRWPDSWPGADRARSGVWACHAAEPEVAARAEPVAWALAPNTRRTLYSAAFFIGVASKPSIPADALVTTASVRSGMISETAPTNVVLLAPNPPEISIFVEAAPRRSECS
jgi:hypothetical protein